MARKAEEENTRKTAKNIVKYEYTVQPAAGMKPNDASLFIFAAIVVGSRFADRVTMHLTSRCALRANYICVIDFVAARTVINRSVAIVNNNLLR